MRFRTTILGAGKTATGIPVPEEVFSGLGPGRRHAIVVTLGGHSYRSTVAPYRGEIMIPLSAPNREAAGVVAGQEVEIDIELDTRPREVEVPQDLADAIAAVPSAAAAFSALSFTNQNRHVVSVEGAKTAETRQRRIEKAVAELSAG
jgi:hypothetical protein